MQENKKLWDYNSIEEAMEPVSYKEEAEIAESQLFMTPGQMIVRRFFRNKLAVAGLIILIAIAFLCIVVPFFYAYNETEIFYINKTTGQEVRAHDSEDLIIDSLLNILEKPSSRHILGTNNMGQDMLARLMFGGRVSLMVGFIVVFVEMVLGIFFGGLAGYFGGWVDTVIMRFVEMLSSIPFVPLMLIISSLLVSIKVSPAYKIFYVMFVLGAIFWTSIARLVRGNLLSLREAEYMQAADATGIKVRHKIFRHLIPNTLPNLIVAATLDLGGVILMESTLSFLGVGVGAPYASWGNMVQAVSDSVVMRFHPNVWIAPGLCILITILAFNFVGDGLRDATDPRMKR